MVNRGQSGVADSPSINGHPAPLPGARGLENNTSTPRSRHFVQARYEIDEMIFIEIEREIVHEITRIY